MQQRKGCKRKLYHHSINMSTKTNKQTVYIMSLSFKMILNFGHETSPKHPTILQKLATALCSKGRAARRDSLFYHQYRTSTCWTFLQHTATQRSLAPVASKLWRLTLFLCGRHHKIIPQPCKVTSRSTCYYSENQVSGGATNRDMSLKETCFYSKIQTFWIFKSSLHGFQKSYL